MDRKKKGKVRKLTKSCKPRDLEICLVYSSFLANPFICVCKDRCTCSVFRSAKRRQFATADLQVKIIDFE